MKKNKNPIEARADFDIFETIQGPPSKPTGPITVSDIQKTSATIEWKPPQSDGGLPLKGYVVELKEARKTMWKKVDKLTPDITTLCIQNLNENAEYYFRVFAENSAGFSEPLEMDTSVLLKSPFSKWTAYILKFLIDLS